MPARADKRVSLRVRLAITFAPAFSMVAEPFGLATILGAFLAGVIVRWTDESPASQEEFQGKLEAIGFGFLIPVFLVSTGVGLDIASLFRSTRRDHLTCRFSWSRCWRCPSWAILVRTSVVVRRS